MPLMLALARGRERILLPSVGYCNIRIARQWQNALAVGRHLAGHPRLRAVHYPATARERLAVARWQTPSGFGPLLSSEIDGEAADSNAAVAPSRLILPATSFGGAEPTWERRACRAAETVPESLIRLSAGTEQADDLNGDIGQRREAAG